MPIILVLFVAWAIYMWGLYDVVTFIPWLIYEFLWLIYQAIFAIPLVLLLGISIIFNTIGDVFHFIFSTIGDVFHFIFSTIGDFFTWIFLKWIAIIFNTIGDVFHFIFNTIGDVFHFIFDAVGELFKRLATKYFTNYMPVPILERWLGSEYLGSGLPR